mgnify:CR=1 FL=1
MRSVVTQSKHPVEELAEPLVQMLLGGSKPRSEVLGALEHADLLVEAVEEPDVAGLIGELIAGTRAQLRELRRQVTELDRDR